MKPRPSGQGDKTKARKGRGKKKSQHVYTERSRCKPFLYPTVIDPYSTSEDEEDSGFCQGRMTRGELTRQRKYSPEGY